MDAHGQAKTKVETAVPSRNDFSKSINKQTPMPLNEFEIFGSSDVQWPFGQGVRRGETRAQVFSNSARVP